MSSITINNMLKLHFTIYRHEKDTLINCLNIQSKLTVVNMNGEIKNSGKSAKLKITSHLG